MEIIKKVFREKFVDYLIQALFIFLSVFLAFWLNQYQAIYKEAYMTTRAELAILKEMKNNLFILEILHENRLPLVLGEKETLDQLETYKAFSQYKLVGQEKGFMRTVLSKSALSLINANNVNIDISRRQQLNKVYEHQQVYTNAERKLFDDFLNSFEVKDPENTRASYSIFYRLLGDIWSKEVTLINSLKEAIAKLEEG
ncbi:MAG: hypothetical protein AB8G86_04965 [Saprospiraceae bacterium]